MAEWLGGAPEFVRFSSFTQAQAERDRYKADLDSLRAALEGEVELLRNRVRVNEDRSVDPVLSGAPQARAAVRAVTYSDSADRLQAILNDHSREGS